MAERASGLAVDDPSEDSLAALGPLLDRLEVVLTEIEGLDDEVRDRAFELLDGVDAVHRLAIVRLADALGDEVSELRHDPAIDWLFAAYGIGVDDVAAASAALDEVRPYIHEHGGEVEVLAVRNGVVRVRLTGACSGCTSAADTLRHGIEEALRENMAGFVAMDVEPDEAPAHPPPTPVQLQKTRHRS